jgi:hypothetical protein
MRYSLHEIDTHHAVATTVAADRDEALEWFSEKLRLMLTFEGNPVAAEYLLDEWPESLPYMAHSSNRTIPVLVAEQWLPALEQHKALDVVRVLSGDRLSIVSAPQQNAVVFR